MWLWPMVLSLYLVILYINKSLISCYLLILLSSTSDPTLHNQNAWNISLVWIIPVSLLQLWHLNFSDCQGLKWRVYWNFFVWPGELTEGGICSAKYALQCCWVSLSSIKFYNGTVGFWNTGLWVQVNFSFNVRDANILQQLCGVFCLHKRAVRQNKGTGLFSKP